MDQEETKEESRDHYICLGGCRGVSKTRGVCKTQGCPHYGHELTKCDCWDGLHYNFEPSHFDKV